MIPNFPVTSKDITNSHLILGPDLTGIMGGGVSFKPDIVETYCVAILWN